MQRGLIALAAVQRCFSLFPVFGRLAMDPASGFAPFAVAVWRIGIGSAVLLPLILALHGRQAIPARADISSLAFLAFLGIAALGLFAGMALVVRRPSNPPAASR